MTTFGGVSNRDIDPDNGNLAVLIDRNDNKRYDFAQYIFFAGGRIRGVLVDLPSGRPIDRTAPVARVNPESFRTVIHAEQGQQPWHLSLRRVRLQPGRTMHAASALHRRHPEHVPADPARSSSTDPHHPGSVSLFSTDASADLTAPIDFSFHDDPFGTGVKRWTVQRQEVGGGGEWEAVGTGTGTSVFDVPGEEGATYDVRVSIVDKQKNAKVTAAERTTFPFDDRNSIVTYSDPMRALGGQPGSFLGTTTFLDQGETATISFDGSAVLRDRSSHRDYFNGDGRRSTVARPKSRTRPVDPRTLTCSRVQRRITHRCHQRTYRGAVRLRRILRDPVKRQASTRLAGSLSPACHRARTNSRSLSRLR